MNKWLKAWSIFIFTIGGLLVLLIIRSILLFLHFKATLHPDEYEEAKVLLQANYPTMTYEISGVEAFCEENFISSIEYFHYDLPIEHTQVKIFSHCKMG
ncbi:hypothetical protein [Lysinibacillus fusiformis]|uniref:hypothetical protein n=1 Tax=Lysinibacillus fusiformis TaxID=28031 RepID=UPI000D372F86|nr:MULTISPECIES: hypothetical protein [Lysinibacillus]MED4668402.1 hypothetical protein [Lysinibacillus fusiformis]QAS58793.1 hypothetical protein LSP_21905 [Lysinibacillus sphaericus]RDV29474.1 hypothetical protein C7B90_16345 [Lysinibacillus fusiformis]GED63760.1 hypothetical protein LFU01_22120 [Lysinibacillus fusiformis]